MIILFLLSIFLFFIFNKHKLFVIYILFFLLNIFINFLVKIFFKYPRPKEDLDLFPFLKTKIQIEDYNRFGMPARSCQSDIFSTIFLFFSLKKMDYTVLFIFISVYTIVQNYIQQKYTISQIIIGCLLGIIIGFMGYLFSIWFLKEKLTEKQEENASISFGLL
jgi:hypothetical protein